MMLRRYHKKKIHLPPTKGYGVPIDTVFPKSLVEMTVDELKNVCKERGLKGYSKLKQDELIELLTGSGEQDATKG